MKKFIKIFIIIVPIVAIAYFVYKTNIIEDIKDYNREKTVNIKLVIPEYICESREELFTKYFTKLYYYAMDVNGEKLNNKLAEYELNNIEELLKFCSTMGAKTRDMQDVGKIFSDYYLKRDVGGRLLDQMDKEPSYVGYLLKNQLYEEFIKFTQLFFYYWRLDEDYTGYSSNNRDPLGSDYLASPHASVIDTAKFFYFTKETLPNYFRNKTVPKLYDEVPGILKTKLNRNITYTYKKTEESECIIYTGFDVYDYEFMGWYLNEDYTGEKIDIINPKNVDKYKNENDEIVLYGRFKGLNAFDERIENLEYPWE